MSEMHERLAEARKAAGYDTVKDAAESMGIPYPTYIAHENGTGGFRVPTAQRYARKFRVSLDWLLTGKGEGPGQPANNSTPSWKTELSGAIMHAVEAGADVVEIHEEFEALLPMDVFRKMKLLGEMGPDLLQRAEAIAATASGRQGTSDEDGTVDTSGSRRTP